jgi:hypothetical protein
MLARDRDTLPTIERVLTENQVVLIEVREAHHALPFLWRQPFSTLLHLSTQ